LSAQGVAAAWPIYHGDISGDLVGKAHAGLQNLSPEQVERVARLVAQKLEKKLKRLQIENTLTISESQQTLLSWDAPVFKSPSIEIKSDDAFVYAPRYGSDQLGRISNQEISSIIANASPTNRTIVVTDRVHVSSIQEQVQTAQKSDFVKVFERPEGFYTGSVLNVALVVQTLEAESVSWRNAYIGRADGAGFQLPVTKDFNDRVFLVPESEIISRILTSIHNLPYLRTIDTIARAAATAA
jgi:hypothetical protein